MKKLLTIAILAIVTLVAAQTLDQTFYKLITRVLTPQTQAQFNKIDDVWNLLWRPAKTNSTLQKVEITRKVTPTATNYTVRAFENVKVRLVEQ